MIRSWRVSEEVSMSDHRYITFELAEVNPESRLWKNPRKTDWTGYEEKLAAKVKYFPDRLRTGCEIEHCADSLRECIVTIVRAYENNCCLIIKKYSCSCLSTAVEQILRTCRASGPGYRL